LDVAKIAKVSKSTVSRALSGQGRIGRQTKNKIIELTKKINFIPSANARRMRCKFNELIGVIIKDFCNPFYMEFLKLLEEKTYRRGFTILTVASNDDIEKEKNLMQLMARHEVGWLITIPHGSLFRELIKYSSMMNIIVLNSLVTSKKFITVCIDNEKAFEDGVEYIYKSGYKLPSLALSSPVIDISEARIRGFLNGVKKYYNQKFDFIKNNLVFKTEGEGKNGGIEIIKKELYKKTDCIFAVNDITAIGIIEECNRKKISIPEKFGLLGFDNVPSAEYVSPKLSSIGQPLDEMTDYILKIICNEEKKSKIFSTQIINRETMVLF
ncbi:MAG: hypothetical protein A2096_04140, partial [Spirochaetes bacterium GWF1_41_5]